MRLLRRLTRSLRYRLGYHVVAPELEEGTDEGVIAYYNSRVSECAFLEDPAHYERPRVDWLVEKVQGGDLLEVGSADGGVTSLLAPRVARVTALDVCAESIERLQSRKFDNVDAVCVLLERFEPQQRFDWAVLSEVVEHLRDPGAALARVLGWMKPGGRILLTVPDGDWEGDAIEHLHTFRLASWSGLLVSSGAHSFCVSTIRDHAGVNRWLAAEVTREPPP